MICEASTNLARALRSLGENFERSALMSVGAKRAVICSSFALSGIFVSSAAIASETIVSKKVRVTGKVFIGLKGFLSTDRAFARAKTLVVEGQALSRPGRHRGRPSKVDRPLRGR